MRFGHPLIALVLVSAAAVLICATDVAAQDAKAERVADDLRAALAGPQDIAEGKRVAETCSRCHGANGISTMKGVPHMAGQRPAYLYAKLKAYQAGIRHHEQMESAVKFLADDALVKVAAFYASLDPAPPFGAVGGKPLPAKPDPVAAGKAAAAACGGCHGEGGVSSIPGMPSLVGMDPKYLVTAMRGYTNGQRKHDMMKALVTPLTDADLDNISLYYALQKPAKAKTPGQGDQAAGKKAAAACAGCHGNAGASSNPANPSIAGQDAQYLVAALHAYKDGSRTEGSMRNAVTGLDEGTIKNLAAFYAAQQPEAPKVARPLTTAQWVSRCDRCHGINGNSTDVRTPALAAQRPDYLEDVLRAYQRGERKDSVMAAMSSSLSDADIAGLAAYYARQRARAVVYVPLPHR